MWSTIFAPSKLRFYEISSDSKLFNHKEILQMFNISINFKDTKKADHILKISLLSLYFVIYHYQLMEIENDFQCRHLNPILLGHPVQCSTDLNFKSESLIVYHYNWEQWNWVFSGLDCKFTRENLWEFCQLLNNNKNSDNQNTLK